MLMKLVRELLILTCLLLFLVLTLLINLSFFSETSTNNADEQKELLIDKPTKIIKNQLGKKLFKDNCAACHNRNMRYGMVGPALGGVRERWEDHEGNIYEFVRNSQVVIHGGNDYAKDLFKKWGSTQMPAFLNLKVEEIDSILNYIDEVYAP